MSNVRGDLPGSELVERGLADLAGGRESAEALRAHNALVGRIASFARAAERMAGPQSPPLS